MWWIGRGGIDLQVRRTRRYSNHVSNRNGRLALRWTLAKCWRRSESADRTSDAREHARRHARALVELAVLQFSVWPLACLGIRPDAIGSEDRLGLWVET
jgi:hypothetical protein